MKCRLVKLTKFSGDKASIYSIILNDEQETLFDKFLKENKDSYLSETNNILIRLQTIGHKAGARENFFKLFEGIPGDGLCALYDLPKKNLRLYCIRYGTQIIILGGGGPKTVRTLQQDKKLSEENKLLRQLSALIYKRIVEKEINFVNDGLEFQGNIEFIDEDDEK